jgi:hypothetical protein
MLRWDSGDTAEKANRFRLGSLFRKSPNRRWHDPGNQTQPASATQVRRRFKYRSGSGLVDETRLQPCSCWLVPSLSFRRQCQVSLGLAGGCVYPDVLAGEISVNQFVRFDGKRQISRDLPLSLTASASTEPIGLIFHDTYPPNSLRWQISGLSKGFPQL